MIPAMIAAAGEGIMNDINNKRNEERSLRNNKDLQRQQFEHQKLLNKQGQEIQLDTWNKTNYGAQMKHMKNAGLSPGMMYGQSGGGGATTGSQSGGSASGGGMGISRSYDIGNLAIQKAQIDNMNADTELKNKQAGTEVTKTGLNEETIGKVIAETENVKIKSELLELQKAMTEGNTELIEEKKKQIVELTKGEVLKNQYTDESRDLLLKGLEVGNTNTSANTENKQADTENKKLNIHSQYNNIEIQIEEIEKRRRENQIGKETADKEVEKKYIEVAKMEIDKQLSEKKIELNEQQRLNLISKIKIEWTNTSIKGITGIINSVAKVIGALK